MYPEPKTYAPDDLRVGLSAEFEHAITEEEVLAFARLSGDFNPLHVDRAYAARSNFRDRIVHGAYQVGLASALIGMYLPGRNVLLGSVNARFPSPLYFPSKVKVRGELTSWNRAQLAGQVKVTVLEQADHVPTAEILLGFTFHEQHAAAGAVAAPAPVSRSSASAGPVALVTGAAGGLGSALVADLARDHTVLALVHRQPLDDGLRRQESVQEIECDLSRPDWEGRMAAALDGRPLYAVVHAAWPGVPHGGLLDAADEVLESQLAFGTTYPIRLARLLSAHVGPAGGRLVVLGSMSGSRKPVISRAAYSLGKAALEHTIKLLAPELARKRITVNAVGPTFVPVGMNRQSHERQIKLETAQVPLGRLATSQDVVQAVRYLLSEPAGFISGQFLGLTGGQL